MQLNERMSTYLFSKFPNHGSMETLYFEILFLNDDTKFGRSIDSIHFILPVTVVAMMIEYQYTQKLKQNSCNHPWLTRRERQPILIAPIYLNIKLSFSTYCSLFFYVSFNFITFTFLSNIIKS